MRKRITVDIYGCEQIGVCNLESMLSKAMKDRLDINLHSSCSSSVFVNGTQLQNTDISSIIDAINTYMYMPSAA